MAPEPGQAIGIGNETAIARLDHKHGLALAHRQTVAALRVGAHQLLPIGDDDIGKTRLITAPPWRAVALFEHHAIDHDIARMRSACEQAQGQESETKLHWCSRDNQP